MILFQFSLLADLCCDLPGVLHLAHGDGHQRREDLRHVDVGADEVHHLASRHCVTQRRLRRDDCLLLL